VEALRPKIRLIVGAVPDHDLAAELILNLVLAAMEAQESARQQAAVEARREKWRTYKRGPVAPPANDVPKSSSGVPEEFQRIPLNEKATALIEISESEEKEISESEEESRSAVTPPPDLVASEPPEPPVMTFPTRGKVKEWHLLQAFVRQCEEAFPGADVIAQFRAARLWCEANPAKRKTAKGMQAFLARWLSNNADKPARASPANGKPADIRVGHARVDPNFQYPVGEQEI